MKLFSALTAFLAVAHAVPLPSGEGGSDVSKIVGGDSVLGIGNGLDLRDILASGKVSGIINNIFSIGPGGADEVPIIARGNIAGIFGGGPQAGGGGSGSNPESEAQILNLIRLLKGLS